MIGTCYHTVSGLGDCDTRQAYKEERLIVTVVFFPPQLSITFFVIQYQSVSFLLFNERNKTNQGIYIFTTNREYIKLQGLQSRRGFRKLATFWIVLMD